MKILITGGASGLGEAITRCLAKESGNEIYFTYHGSAANANTIVSDHANTFSIACDFRNETEIASLRERISSIDIDVLINNAYTGNFIDSYFHKTPVQSYSDAFANNILPTIAITQAAIDCFRKKKSGKIITILSAVLAGMPPIGTSIYVANKAYLAALTKVWAIENAKFNITSNTISPSFMQTALTKDVDERVIDQIREQSPSKKLLTTEEAAAAVLLLIKAGPEINGIDHIINQGADVI